MFCIGLTGSIGSGKSTAAQILTSFGGEVLSADAEAHFLTANDPEVKLKLQQQFGEDIYTDDGKLKRKTLRKIIFNDPAQKKWLDNFLHPKIRERLHQLINQSTAKFCVIEIPLLTSRENFSYLDHIILITAPNSLQIARINQRDQTNDAEQILAMQPSQEVYNQVADSIITNDSDLKALQGKLQHTLKHLNLI